MELDVAKYLDELTTEQPNPNSFGIDAKSTKEILKIINHEDSKVPEAIGREIPAIAQVIDLVVEHFKQGGRLFYIGAGTSGRLGVLDAAECPPTYGTPPEMVQGIIAGGREALVRSIEGAEDIEADGVKAINDRGVNARDVLIGITASGHAPYVIGAIKRARELGAPAVALSCNKNSKTFQYADYRLFIDVGPEIVTGSTRMKSGTAQKLVLNMITTAAMIKLGKVFNNLMVDLMPVNNKLVVRSKRLIQTATGCDPKTAARAFADSGKRPKVAIVMVILGINREEAEQLLQANEGRIGQALTTYRKHE
ncbi:MAG: N-acetylmuramic acid 6-phosphate etherase [Spirochaetia bacterium]